MSAKPMATAAVRCGPRNGGVAWCAKQLRTAALHWPGPGNVLAALEVGFHGVVGDVAVEINELLGTANNVIEGFCLP